MSGHTELWKSLYGDKAYPRESNGQSAWYPNRSECYLLAGNGSFDMNTQSGVLSWLHFKISSRIREIQYQVIDVQHRHYSDSETAESLYLKKLLAVIDFQNPAASLSRLSDLYVCRFQALLSRGLDEDETADLADVKWITNLIQQTLSGASVELPPELVTQPEPKPATEQKPVPEAPKPTLVDALIELLENFRKRLSFLQQKGAKTGRTVTEDAEQAALTERIRDMESKMNADAVAQRELVTSLQARFAERTRVLMANPISTLGSQAELSELFRLQSLLQQSQESVG